MRRFVATPDWPVPPGCDVHRFELANWMGRRAAGTARAGGSIFSRPILGTQRDAAFNDRRHA
jgi:hypothetical protein